MGLLVKTPSPLKQKSKSKRQRATTFGAHHEDKESENQNENEAENNRSLHCQGNGSPVSSRAPSIPILVCEVKHGQHNVSETIQTAQGKKNRISSQLSKQDILRNEAPIVLEDRNDEDALHQRGTRFSQADTGLAFEFDEEDSGKGGQCRTSSPRIQDEDRSHPLTDDKSMPLYEAFECIVPRSECESEEYFSCDEEEQNDDTRHDKEENDKKTSSFARVLGNLGPSRWKISSSGNNCGISNRSKRSIRSIINNRVRSRSNSNSNRGLIQLEQDAKEIEDTLSTVTTEKSEECIAKREEEEEQMPQKELPQKVIELKELDAADPDSGLVPEAEQVANAPAVVPESGLCVVPGSLPDKNSSTNANANEFQEDILDPIFESSSYGSANESEATDFDDVFDSVSLASFEIHSEDREETVAQCDINVDDMVIRDDTVPSGEDSDDSIDESSSKGDEAIQDSSDEAVEENSIDDSDRDDVGYNHRAASESFECDHSGRECFERSESEHRAFHERRAAALKTRPPEPLWVRNDDKRNELAWVRCAARNRDRPMDFPISKRRLDINEQEEESTSPWFSYFSVCGEVFVL